MNRFAVLAAAILPLLAVPTLAQEHEGFWSGQGEGDITLDLTHVENDVYKISINTVVPISDVGGCAGGIDGEVILTSEGGNFFVENEDYDPQQEEAGLNRRYCEIALTFNEDGTLTTEEKTGCLYYHGAACGFSGTLEHDAAGL
ncbi:hypothetical protein SAMN06295905_1203 [Devosia lucknowensis]|uniref:Uncharacterized protein n=1 Tax=Devosia lucknowensis TaxID=1096929 RepID=A0A1Y6ES33_9HYPH|nr:hypothetical protein [Devosia lucknowensis]SMQ65347.1 hypothetical protein SAMN06295905_1203 [Devosia lucknowensis]